MATSTVLSNPVVTVNNVDITDNVTSAVFHQMITQLRATSFGDSAEKYTAGLGDHSVELEVYQSFAATETWVTLKALVGTTTTVKVKATSAAVSATNPELVLTGAYLAELPTNFALGELTTASVVFTGGTYSEVTSA